MPQPSVGRIVHYVLSDQDADIINKKRADYEAFRASVRGSDIPGVGDPNGHQAHVGNHAAQGQIFPAVIVRMFGGPNVNLQVWLDGTDTYWATSRPNHEGDAVQDVDGLIYEAASWHWPPRDHPRGSGENVTTHLTASH